MRQADIAFRRLRKYQKQLQHLNYLNHTSSQSLKRSQLQAFVLSAMLSNYLFSGTFPIALLTPAQAVSTTYRWVLANDLSSSAIDSMRANLALNSLVDGTTEPKPLPADSIPSKIRVNEGDCSTVMYNHRTDGTKFDVIDLDPYGTASPFLDAAVQSVVDGGKLTLDSADDTADA